MGMGRRSPGGTPAEEVGVGRGPRDGDGGSKGGQRLLWGLLPGTGGQSGPLSWEEAGRGGEGTGRGEEERNVQELQSPWWWPWGQAEPLPTRHPNGSLAPTHTARAEPSGKRVKEVVLCRETEPDSEARPARPSPPPSAVSRGPPPAARTPQGPAGPAPCSLPSLDDGDDVVHLDVQLVWFLKVLKGTHVGGLGLGAERGQCPPWD